MTVQQKRKFSYRSNPSYIRKNRTSKPLSFGTLVFRNDRKVRLDLLSPGNLLFWFLHVLRLPESDSLKISVTHFYPG